MLQKAQSDNVISAPHLSLQYIMGIETKWICDGQRRISGLFKSLHGAFSVQAANALLLTTAHQANQKSSVCVREQSFPGLQKNFSSNFPFCFGKKKKTDYFWKSGCGSTEFQSHQAPKNVPKRRHECFHVEVSASTCQLKFS